MMKPIQTFCIAALAWLLVTPAHARSQSPQRERLDRMKGAANTLKRAGIPGYGVKYTFKPGTPKERKGALLVTGVNRTNLRKWNDKIGKNTIGFQTCAAVNDTGSSSGYVRIGETWMDYDWVRGSTYSGGACAMTGKTSRLTEATYFVTPQEMKAFRAFYHARNRYLIKDSKGNAIDPNWNYPGPSNIKREGCAGAASSALNPAWVKAFKRNLTKIKAYGQQNNIAELKNVPDNAADLLLGFIQRAEAKQQTDPRNLIRHHATTADMLTVFNQGYGSDMMQALKWNRKVSWYTSYSSGRRYRDRDNPNWVGLGKNHTIFDLGPGESSKTYQTQRMTLSSFAHSL